MKKMNLASSLSLSVLMVVSGQAFAAGLSVDRQGDGSLIARICDVGAVKTVGFRVGDNGIEQAVVVDGAGCAVKTYQRGVVSNPSEIQAVVDGKTVKVGERDFGRGRGPGQGPGGVNGGPGGTGGVNGGPGGTNGGPGTVNPGPVLKTVDVREANKEGRQAGMFMVNRVVKIYGKIENVRYNVRQGMIEEDRRFQAYNGDYTSLRTYASGLRVGADDGARAGAIAGKNRASSDGESSGRGMAAGQFAEAVKNGGSLHLGFKDTVAQEMADRFDGLKSDMPIPATVQNRLSNYDKKLAEALKAELSFDDEVIVLSDGVIVTQFGTRGLWGTDYKEALEMGWRSNESIAFDYWSDRDKDPALGIRETNEHRYLRDVSNYQVYSNAQEARMAFINGFKDAVNDNFRQRWNNTVRRDNARARQVGMDIYRDAVQDYAYDLGNYDSYTAEYKSSSAAAYKNAVVGAARNSYDNTVRYYQDNVVLNALSMQVALADGQSRDLAPGDELTLSITAENHGQKPANEMISVTGSGITVRTMAYALEIRGLSKMTEAKVLERVAQLNAGFPFNKKTLAVDANVGIRVAGKSDSRSLSVTLKGFLQKLARADQAVGSTMAGQLAAALGQEFKKEAGLGNAYDAKDMDTMLAKMAKQVYPQLSQADRQGLVKYASQIRAGLGSRPGGFLSTTKDDWDSAMELLKLMGL